MLRILSARKLSLKKIDPWEGSGKLIPSTQEKAGVPSQRKGGTAFLTIQNLKIKIKLFHHLKLLKTFS